MNEMITSYPYVLAEGYAALREKLGVSGMAEFLRLLGGSGDYTKERHKLFEDMSIDDIFDNMNPR